MHTSGLPGKLEKLVESTTPMKGDDDGSGRCRRMNPRPRKRARVYYLMPLLFWGGLSCQVSAAPVMSTFAEHVGFSAPSQSFWGGGTGYSFGTTGSLGTDNLNFSWDIGASTGTVQATVGGVVQTTYVSQIKNPGTLPISLKFIGDSNGGSLKSDMGAWARASATALVEVNLINYDYGLNINKAFSPVIGQSVEGDDFAAVAGAGVNIGIFSTGVNFGIEQVDELLLEGITGSLAYSARGSSKVSYAPFVLDDVGGLDVSAFLPRRGWWDFWLTDLKLDNAFSVEFNAALNFYERHVDGIEWCSKRVFGIRFSWPCGLTYDVNEWQLASLGLYDGEPFSLAFNTSQQGGKFSVYVVPEPPVLMLLLLALLLHLATRSRSRVRVGSAG